MTTVAHDRHRAPALWPRLLLVITGATAAIVALYVMNPLATGAAGLWLGSAVVVLAEYLGLRSGRREGRR